MFFVDAPDMFLRQGAKAPNSWIQLVELGISTTSTVNQGLWLCLKILGAQPNWLWVKTLCPCSSHQNSW